VIPNEEPFERPPTLATDGEQDLRSGPGMCQPE
jgi:hypothetical protein